VCVFIFRISERTAIFKHGEMAYIKHNWILSRTFQALENDSFLEFPYAGNWNAYPMCKVCTRQAQVTASGQNCLCGIWGSHGSEYGDWLWHRVYISRRFRRTFCVHIEGKKRGTYADDKAIGSSENSVNIHQIIKRYVPEGFFTWLWLERVLPKRR
jgi:hypothetical protein